MAKQASRWVRPIFIGVVSGFIVTAIVGAVTYYFAKESIAGMIAEGVSILNVQTTSDSLGEIALSCSEASQMLATRGARPANELVAELRQSFEALADSIGKVQTTEYYSVAEIKQLSNEVTLSIDKKEILAKYMGKPKRVVTGLRRVEPQLKEIAVVLETLDRELEREPTINIEALRNLMSEIQRVASAAQASLDSRQSATLRTLEKFGKKKGSP